MLQVTLIRDVADMIAMTSIHKLRVYNNRNVETEQWTYFTITSCIGTSVTSKQCLSILHTSLYY